VIYDADIEAGIRRVPTYKIYESLTFEDIRNACDIAYAVYEASEGWMVTSVLKCRQPSLMIPEATIKEADAIIKEIGRENVMIKIPARGELAVEQVISEGINVNVTLLFSVESYSETWAYIRGLEKLAESGNDISRISSVAFSLSRIVTLISELMHTSKGVDDDMP